ncbi:hypothetical protein, partial [Roseibium denhamense]|uniref:hypothetical protein n=1 Tax=Roseibium denhamense TaxID=76305 RepID=UPI0031DB05B1
FGHLQVCDRISQADVYRRCSDFTGGAGFRRSLRRERISSLRTFPTLDFSPSLMLHRFACAASNLQQRRVLSVCGRSTEWN